MGVRAPAVFMNKAAAIPSERIATSYTTFPSKQALYGSLGHLFRPHTRPQARDWTREHCFLILERSRQGF